MSNQDVGLDITWIFFALFMHHEVLDSINFSISQASTWSIHMATSFIQLAVGLVEHGIFSQLKSNQYS